MMVLDKLQICYVYITLSSTFPNIETHIDMTKNQIY